MKELINVILIIKCKTNKLRILHDASLESKGPINLSFLAMAAALTALAWATCFRQSLIISRFWKK